MAQPGLQPPTPPFTVFLDRDGVIAPETGAYITSPAQLQILPGSLEAIARLTQAGARVFVFTNQAGVGRGYLTVETLAAVHGSLREQVGAAGGTLAQIYACIHHPDAGCDCRKPKPGMLLQAAAEHGVDFTTSWAIGDSPRDIAAGASVGCRTILVLTGHTAEYDPASFPDPQPDLVCADLLEAARWLTGQR